MFSTPQKSSLGWLPFGLACFWLSHQTLAVRFVNERSVPSITWTNCTANDPPNLQCGQIQVPLDYNDANGAQITLGIAKLKANGTRIGSLLYNPGGPGNGASTYVFLKAFENVEIWSPQLVAQYDIIGLDPRGTGLSNPVQCDQNLWNQRVSYFPSNQDQFNALIAYNQALSASCKNATGPLFDHLDTVNVAKDFEIVRQALNEGKLNFLGQSYGSQIGYTYAGLYPGNVGRMVLDGILDHSQSEIFTLTTESSTYETTLNKFFQWCNTTIECVLNGKDIVGIFDSIVANANANPIPAPGCQSSGANACYSNVTGEDILFNAQDALVFFSPSIVSSGWPGLAIAIAEAAQGNATLLSRPIVTQPTSSQFSSLAIGCQDWSTSSKSYTDLTFKEQLMAVLSPHTKGATQTYTYESQCINWASNTTNPQQPMNPNIANAPPILLVNSLWDPETSLAWANNVRLEIPNSVLILRNGEAHTSYQTYGNTSAAMDEFLLTGTLPPQGTTYES